MRRSRSYHSIHGVPSPSVILPHTRDEGWLTVANPSLPWVRQLAPSTARFQVLRDRPAFTLNEIERSVYQRALAPDYVVIVSEIVEDFEPIQIEETRVFDAEHVAQPADKCEVAVDDIHECDLRAVAREFDAIDPHSGADFQNLSVLQHITVERLVPAAQSNPCSVVAS